MRASTGLQEHFPRWKIDSQHTAGRADDVTHHFDGRNLPYLTFPDKGDWSPLFDDRRPYIRWPQSEGFDPRQYNGGQPMSNRLNERFR